MGKPTGFKEYARQDAQHRRTSLRVLDFQEFVTPASAELLKEQSARCMDCGVPYCHSNHGCPLHNLIPEWNDLVYQGRYREALERLHATNNFPEVTGRVCPAPCEGACVLGIHEPAVTIKDIEREIADRGLASGWVTASRPAQRTGRTVAVIGSGPSGLAAAAELNRAGHSVVVYERDDRPGGLLTYGIPNMKLAKEIVARRIELMRDEGIEFRLGVHVGRDELIDVIYHTYDAVLLAVGSTVPRDLPAPGRSLKGVHFAMDFLRASTKRLLDGNESSLIDARDKNVVVIGGGDTGTDCIATAIRQGCRSVINFELLAEPPKERSADNPWPEWPRVFRVDYGHAEAEAKFGRDPREYRVLTKEFIDDGKGTIGGIRTKRVEWRKGDGKRMELTEIDGSEEVFEADLVLLAMGFTGPESTLLDQMALERDQRSNIRAEFGRYATNVPGVFAAGDCRRGQSLVVWAIAEGRGAAEAIDTYLLSNSASQDPIGNPTQTAKAETRITP